jgi:hypothetical protein
MEFQPSSVGSSCRQISFINDDLPQPLRPTIATRSPLFSRAVDAEQGG